MGKMKETDDFGNRMKSYEVVETSRELDVHLPIYARIDGRAFHTFTRGMNRPFDNRITTAMQHTTQYLVQKTDARIGYTQSDEISLIWLAVSSESDIFFSGKIQKMVSVLASMAASHFMYSIPIELQNKLPHFDTRVFQLPSKEEAANMILWRAMDARKNAISMAAQTYFSHGQLQGKSQKDMLAMLTEIGKDFEADFPDYFKRGSFFQKRTFEREFIEVDKQVIPEDQWPESGKVIRSHYPLLNMPPFNKVANRVEVIFDKEEPEYPREEAQEENTTET